MFHPITIPTFSFAQDICLLNSFFADLISEIMSPEHLLTGAKWLAVAIAVIVSAIYLHLFIKKRDFFYKKRIRIHLEDWITQVIMEEEIDTDKLLHNFRRILFSRAARQFAIDELIVCKKNFSGGVTENIIWLYLQLGLKKDSLHKLRNTAPWHIRAKGIQELYLMEQQDVLKTIYKNTNSNNEFVRMEAQTGVINLTGFPGLRFLDVVSYPITEWQQLKLLEQLHLHPVKQDLSDKIPHWLQATNTTVIVFALKLADEYQVYSVRDQVMACMAHADKTVRSQALKTLVRLADETTPATLAGYFPKESPANQLYILDALRTLATENETDFLVSLLDHENDTVKLKAAVVLAEVAETGMELITEKSRLQPEPFERICRHIKTIK
ncbi:MAG: HEAT repeat domain-containing protein [Bacteroidetes bacterium]|nr:HEAT repeat domain-containing protein [Bacteroidota bacterium]